MSRKDMTPQNREALPEVDLSDMETVSGGCQNCGDPNAQHGQQAQQGQSKLAALAPLIQGMAGK
ncbi:MAG TPA: hypothetical protein VNO33_24280 [Kofleriaceae bacterium]|nr:hypothetical protein [Kofleriaceae bacterium]